MGRGRFVVGLALLGLLALVPCLAIASAKIDKNPSSGSHSLFSLLSGSSAAGSRHHSSRSSSLSLSESTPSSSHTARPCIPCAAGVKESPALSLSQSLVSESLSESLGSQIRNSSVLCVPPHGLPCGSGSKPNHQCTRCVCQGNWGSLLCDVCALNCVHGVPDKDCAKCICVDSRFNGPLCEKETASPTYAVVGLNGRLVPVPKKLETRAAELLANGRRFSNSSRSSESSLSESSWSRSESTRGSSRSESSQSQGLIATNASVLSKNKLKNTPLEALEKSPALQKSFALYYMSVMYDGFAEFGWDSIIRGFKGRIVQIMPSSHNHEEQAKLGAIPPQGLIVEGPYEMYEDLSPSKDNTLVLSMVPVPPDHKLSVDLQLADKSDMTRLVADPKLYLLSEELQRAESKTNQSPTQSRVRSTSELKHPSPKSKPHSSKPTLLQLRDEIANGVNSEEHAYLASVLEVQAQLHEQPSVSSAGVSLQFAAFDSKGLPKSMQRQHDTLFERATAALKRVGVAFEVEKLGSGYGVVQVSTEHVKKAALAIAELPDCLSVEIADKPKLANHWASAIQVNSEYKTAAIVGAKLANQINRKFATELGLDGRGQIVAVADSGLDRSHCFFRHSPSENPVNHGRVEVSDITLSDPAVVPGFDTAKFYKITSLSFSVLRSDGRLDHSIPPQSFTMAGAHTGQHPAATGQTVDLAGPIAHIDKIEHDVDKGLLTAVIGEATNVGGPYTDFATISFSESIALKSGLWESKDYPTSVLRFAHPQGYRMKAGTIVKAGAVVPHSVVRATVRFFPVEHRKIVRYFAGQCDSEDVPNGHGTHVSGSAAGHCDVEGEKAASFSGVGPKAKIVFVDISAHITSLSGIESTEQGQARFFDMVYGSGARIFSGSYGSYAQPKPNTGYTSSALLVDRYVYFNRDFLLLQSAGNNGHTSKRSATDGTIGRTQHAKNLITVGSVRTHKESWTRFQEGEYSPSTSVLNSPCQNAWKAPDKYLNFQNQCNDLSGNADFDADVLAASTSKGPCRRTSGGLTDYGRIKPELMATGEVIVSSRAHSNLQIRDAPFAVHSIVYNPNIKSDPALLNSVARAIVPNGVTNPAGGDSSLASVTQTGINAGSRLLVDARRYSKNGDVCPDKHFTFSVEVEVSAANWQPLTSVDGRTDILVPRLPDDLTQWHRVEYRFKELNADQRAASTMIDHSDVASWQPTAKQAKFRILQKNVPNGCSLIFTRFDLVKASAGDPSKFDTIDSLLLHAAVGVATRFTYTTQPLFGAPDRLDMSELRFNMLTTVNAGDDRFAVLGPFDMSAGARIELEHVKGPGVGHATVVEFKLIFQVKNSATFAWEDVKQGSCVAVPAITVDAIPQRYVLDCPPEYSSADSELAKNRYADPNSKINKARKYARLLIRQLNSHNLALDNSAFRLRFLVVRVSSLDSTGSLLSMTGTSMATPVAAGTFTVVRQYFTDGFHVEGRRRFADGFNPSAALLRAVVLNTAKDLSNGAGGHYTVRSLSNNPLAGAGVEAGWIRGYPGYGQGFGRTFAGKALYVQQNDPAQNYKLIVFNKVDQIVNGNQVFQYRVLVPEKSRSELRVMLSHTDVPINPITSNRIVQHVIGLEVTDRVGPNKNEIPNGADFGTTPYETNNNNNKRVIIEANDIVAGIYTITITATAPGPTLGLTTDIFKFTKRLPDFALVAHGPRLARVDHLYHVRIELPEYPAARHTDLIARTCELTVTTYSATAVKRSFECPLPNTVYVLTLQEPINFATAVTVVWQRNVNGAAAVDAIYVGILDFFTGTLHESAPCASAQVMGDNDAQISQCTLAVAVAPAAATLGNTKHRFEVTLWSPDSQACPRVREVVNQDLELQVKLEVSKAIDITADIVKTVDSGAVAFGKTTKDFRNMDTVHHRTIEDEWATAADPLTITNLVIKKAGAGLTDGAGQACEHWDIRKIRVHHVNSKTTWAWESVDGPWTVSTTDLKLGLPTWKLYANENPGALCGMCHRMMEWSYEQAGGNDLADLKTAVCDKIPLHASKNLVAFERCGVVVNLLSAKVNALNGANLRTKMRSFQINKGKKPAVIHQMCTTDLKLCGGGIDPNTHVAFDLSSWASEY